jgi:hypothetical protein
MSPFVSGVRIMTTTNEASPQCEHHITADVNPTALQNRDMLHFTSLNIHETGDG